MSVIEFKSIDKLKTQVINQLVFKKSKTILFIQPYGACLSLLLHGLSKGYQIIIFSAQKDLRVVSETILSSVALTIIIDTANEESVLSCSMFLQEIIQIHAVVPGFEYFVPLAAKVNESLNLPGVPLNKVMQLRRKDVMRLCLREANIAVPRFAIIQSIAELDQAIEEIGFPAICKPVDAAGSVYVRKVNDKKEARAAVLAILENKYLLWGYELSRIVLFEEYIEGKEYSLEGVVQQGNIIHFSLTEKIVSDEIEFIEIGHIVNSPISLMDKKIIENYVNQILIILGADNCPFHAEVRLAQNKPILMEIAARLAGDKIGDLINLSGSVNYFDYVYAAYGGEQLPDISQSGYPTGIRFFYRPQIASYQKIEGTETLKQAPIEELLFYYQPGHPIPDFPKPLRRLGHVIAKNKDYVVLEKMLNEIDEMIVFE